MEGKNSHKQSCLTYAFTIWNMPSALCPPYWTLTLKLHVFQDNIANVINTIQANKITEDSSQAVQGLMIR